MIDLLAMAVFLLALWAILKDSVPTGILGSLGLALIGIAALVAADDQSFASIDRLKSIVLALLSGFVLLALQVVLQVVLLVWRARTGALTPRRRATDVGHLARHVPRRAR